MNILFTSDHALNLVNGVVKHILLVKEELEKRHHRVIIICPKNQDAAYKEPKDVLHIPSFPFPFRYQDRVSLFFINRKIKKTLSKIPIDIVHNHCLTVGILGKNIAQKGKIPLIGTLHMVFQDYIYALNPRLAAFSANFIQWFSRKYFHSYDLIITNSAKGTHSLKKSGVKNLNYVLHNGINLEYIGKVNPVTFKKIYHLKKGDPLIVLIGRIDPEKNVLLAVKAFQLVHKKIPNAKLAIIGDGSERKNIQAYINKYDLHESVFITGFINYDLVISANKSASLAIITSIADTLPTVAIEAIACGKSIVGVKDDAITPMVKNGRNGLLTQNTPSSLAKGIIKLLQNKKLRAKYESESLKIAQEFSIKKHVDKLEKIYQEMINQ